MLYFVEKRNCLGNGLIKKNDKKIEPVKRQRVCI